MDTKRLLLFLLIFFTSFEYAKQQENAEIPTYSDIEIDSTYINPNGTDSNETKLYLLGFGNYKRPVLSIITFTIYFKRIGFIPMGPTISFTIAINYQRRRRLRSTQGEITNSTCYKISETEDRINYNCSAPVDQNKTIETVESLGDFQMNGEEIKTEETSTSINVNIANETGTELGNEYIDLYDGVYTLDENNKRFTIEGTVNKTFYEKEITLVVDEDDNGEKKEIPCTVSNNGTNYTLTCTLRQKIINASLDKDVCIGDNQNLLIHMKDENVKLNYSPYGNPISNSYRSRGSGGLSGGAIAAIVIICSAVLLAVIATSILLKRRKNKDKIHQESNVGLYSSSTNKI